MFKKSSIESGCCAGRCATVGSFRLAWVAMVLVVFALIACGTQLSMADEKAIPAPAVDLAPVQQPEDGPPVSTDREAVFAGGCFWCVEAVFEQLAGVGDVISGYAGGSADSADYTKVSAGQTDHAEVVKVVYDSSKITYGQLLHVFFSTHDPLTARGQHPDYGKQYRPAIFYANDEQKSVAAAYIRQLNEADVFDKPIATGLEPLDAFYPAEEYHQDFVKKHPSHGYVRQWAVPKVQKVHRKFGHLLKPEFRESNVSKIEKTEEQWRDELSPEEFYVLRKEGTERPGSSPLNKEKRKGTFICAGCDLPLFESSTKFESGTGWPSFYKPIENHVTEKVDRSLGMVRTEVECARCGGHLGHVFNDGPEPTGLRYCINGVALDFEQAADGEGGE